LILKPLFQYKTIFLQSSKVVTFLEMHKKKCFSEKNYAKTFISIHFVFIFVATKCIDFV